MVELTYMHYIYLAVIVVVIALMILKHDVVVPCIVGLFVLGFCYSGFSVIGGAQAVFNGMMVAGADLFDIMLIIALMVAMLKAMEAIGADKMMIAPAARVIKSPTVAFVVIAVVMYICASFFWPTPATALVGTILIPIAMKAGLKPMMACMAMNLAGHGLALSGDLVLQGAPALSAGASNADLPSIVANGGILATLTGVVAFAVAAVIYRKEITARYIPDGTDNVQQAVEVANPPKCAKAFAVIVPVVFFIIVLRIIAGAAIPTMSKIFGGDATALLGGAASILLILICLVTDSKTFLEKIGEYLRTGMLFSIKIFAVVIPIAAFFYLGNPESCPSILGEGAPGFLFDLGNAMQNVLPLNPFTLAIGIAVIGGITGLDGSGFSGVPLVAGLAAALGGPLGYDVTMLAALGQVAAIWVGGGCLSAWAFGAVASAGVAGVSSAELVRKNFVPVIAGLIAASLFTAIML